MSLDLSQEKRSTVIKSFLSLYVGKGSNRIRKKNYQNLQVAYKYGTYGIDIMPR
jgi:hypothetical protein